MQARISLYAHRKLISLDLKSQRKFLRIIYKFLTGKLAGNQARQLTGNPRLIRIRYNRNDRIIGTVFKTEGETQFRIFDFVSHDEMDRGQYFQNIKIPEADEQLELNEVSISNEFPQITSKLQEQIEQSRLWDSNSSLDQITQQCPAETDFYIYSIANQAGETPDLSLSPLQYEVVEQPLPVFLAGTAGSGKTTIALYHALKKTIEIQTNQIDQTVAYITYSHHLKEYAKRIIEQIYDLDQLPKLKLFDYNQLCRQLGMTNDYFPPDRQVTQQTFIEDFFNTRLVSSRKNIDPIALWQEIRHLIKGSVPAASNQNQLISEQQYRQKCQNLGDNWQSIYQLAKEYQQWLHNNNYWDEIDLTHSLLKHRDKITDKYNYLYCDEIQDLTEIQIDFLLKLLRYPYPHELPQLFFTGDTAQIINPSGFSWNKVKTVLHQNYSKHPQWEDTRHSLDEPQQLSYNFRSTTNIVQFNNQILKLNQHDTETQVPYREDGTKPTVIQNITKEQFLEGRTLLGPKNAIITVNEEEKQKLIHQFSKNNIKSERILMISEIKGLEFDEVLVWNFFYHFNDWISRTRGNLNELEKFKYNCLYVCGTRARDRLYFYEAQSAPFWDQAELFDYIQYSSNPLDTASFFNPNITPKDWWDSAQEFEQQGEYLKARENYLRGGWQKDTRRVEAKNEQQEGHYQNAADIWGELGEIHRQIEALKQIENYVEIADIYQRQGEFFKAASMWEKAENYKKAAHCYEKNSEWAEAERCWEKINDGTKLAEACENQKTPEKYLKAGKTWQQISQLQRAANCYEKASAWQQAEQCWHRLQNWPKVAKACEKQEKWQEAAHAWEQTGEITQAAQSCEQGEHWVEAAQYWQQMANFYQVALTYQRCAGKTWEALQELEKAAQAYEYGEYWTKTEQLWGQLNNWFRLAQVYDKQQKWKDAAEQWLYLDKTEAAAKAYEKGQYYLQAEQCWRQLKAWEKVAQLCQQQNTLTKWQEAGEIWKWLKHWEQGGYAFQKSQNWEQAGKCYEQAQNWKQAEHCWEKTGNKPPLANACYQQQKFDKAARLWQELHNWAKAAIAWKQAGKLKAAAKCYEKDQDWKNAEQCWLVLGNWEKVAQARQKQNNWKGAADAWYHIDHIRQAAECYDKGRIWAQAETCWERLEKWQNVAKACEQQDKYGKAGQMWESVSQWTKAASCYEQVAHWQKAERCWRKVGDQQRIANACDKQSKWAESAPLWKELKRWVRAAIAYQNLGYLEKAAQYWEKAAQQNENKSFWLEAAKIWEQLAQQQNDQQMLTKAAQAYERGHYGVKAAKLWQQLGKLRRAVIAAGKEDLL